MAVCGEPLLFLDRAPGLGREPLQSRHYFVSKVVSRWLSARMPARSMRVRLGALQVGGLGPPIGWRRSPIGWRRAPIDQRARGPAFSRRRGLICLGSRSLCSRRLLRSPASHIAADACPVRSPVRATEAADHWPVRLYHVRVVAGGRSAATRENKGGPRLKHPRFPPCLHSWRGSGTPAGSGLPISPPVNRSLSARRARTKTKPRGPRPTPVRWSAFLPCR